MDSCCLHVCTLGECVCNLGDIVPLSVPYITLHDISIIILVQAKCVRPAEHTIRPLFEISFGPSGTVQTVSSKAP